MNEIFKKLNYKDQNEIIILNGPESFQSEIESMKHLVTVKDKLRRH